jgi:hypothetical protein
MNTSRVARLAARLIPIVALASFLAYVLVPSRSVGHATIWLMSVTPLLWLIWLWLAARKWQQRNSDWPLLLFGWVALDLVGLAPLLRNGLLLSSEGMVAGGEAILLVMYLPVGLPSFLIFGTLCKFAGSFNIPQNIDFRDLDGIYFWMQLSLCSAAQTWIFIRLVALFRGVEKSHT